jgi:hypothetical protein
MLFQIGNLRQMPFKLFANFDFSIHVAPHTTSAAQTAPIIPIRLLPGATRMKAQVNAVKNRQSRVDAPAKSTADRQSQRYPYSPMT